MQSQHSNTCCIPRQIFRAQAYKNTESSNGEYSRLHKLHQFFRSKLQRKPLLRRAHYDVNPSILRHTRIDTIYRRTFHLQVMRGIVKKISDSFRLRHN